MEEVGFIVNSFLYLAFRFVSDGGGGGGAVRMLPRMSLS